MEFTGNSVLLEQGQGAHGVLLFGLNMRPPSVEAFSGYVCSSPFGKVIHGLLQKGTCPAHGVRMDKSPVAIPLLYCMFFSAVASPTFLFKYFSSRSRW